MTTATATLSTTPRIVAVEIARELSGRQWCGKFSGEDETSALAPGFRECVEAFVSALADAGAHVHIGAVFRPRERAYLMHWSYMLFKGRVTADKVPYMQGVEIEWQHPTAAASFAAAKDMCHGYNIQDLGTTPALRSQHEVRLAIDVSIQWTGTLVIANRDGTKMSITSAPRSGMHPELIQVGATYGVIKYNKSGIDKPHWSSTGA